LGFHLTIKLFSDDHRGDMAIFFGHSRYHHFSAQFSNVSFVYCMPFLEFVFFEPANQEKESCSSK